MKEATDVFARALVSVSSAFDDLPLVRANAVYRDRYGIPYDELYRFYRQRIGTASSKKELAELIARGT